MKKILSLLAMLIAVHYSYAQWTTSGTNTTTTDNVGIGTTSPSNRLEVYQATSGAQSYAQFNTINTGTGATHGLTVGYNSIANLATVFNRENSNLIFGTNNLTRMTIDNSGNVGIGTTSPGFTLDVISPNTNITRFSNSAGSLFLNGSTTNEIVSRNSGNTAFQDVNIRAGSSGQGITVKTNGSVGIGVTSPVAINASSALFPSATPLMEMRTGTVASDNPYSELITVRHVGITAAAVNRQLGLVFKLSDEASLSESNKMAGLILESSNAWANNPSLNLVTSNVKRLTIDQNGNVGIGTTNPDQLLSVNGTIHSKQVKVDLTGWPDYVFKPEYHLPSLSEVKNYIDQNQHLPNMPSEIEVAKNGVDLGEMVKLQTKKIEELILYLIDKDKKQQQHEAKIAELEERLNTITKK